ncbi:MAG: NUDIX domain-containing protein [Bacteroidetes bacterium]|nr:NUDIX domain-containing protein [Bacteroidota bacterium]
MKFCSNCGSSDLKFEVPAGDNHLRQVCGNCAEIHYHNPKIITGCLPIWEGQVLLCRRAIEPRAGYWNVPAGFLEIGEAVEDGAMREVWEEAEAKVHILGLQSVFTFTNFYHVYLQFVGELVGGKFGVGEESLESRLFSEEEIPWEEIAFESSRFALRHYFEDKKKGNFKLHIGSI